MQIPGRAMGWILAIIAIIFSSFMAAPAMAVDEPAFKVVGRSGDVELREYVAYMVAETKVNADFSGAGNLAFGPLFKYISGNNRAQEKIEMTAPVSQAAATGKGEKIEMTAPVTQIPAAKGANAYLIAFVMPARSPRKRCRSRWMHASRYAKSPRGKSRCCVLAVRGAKPATPSTWKCCRRKLPRPAGALPVPSNSRAMIRLSCLGSCGETK